ncbi:MAG TPA: protein kinase [Gemmatimonadales bacterium]|nr:protein kinase [Gemmatimonadales bacterium]
MDPNPRLVAALADRYRIERELGQGGMATVYLARDLRHDRNVALKVLRPELAAVIGADRFLAEIKTTAALQHPHILPLFDSGQSDGFLFYVMPLIEGESLRGRLNREHQLPVEDAIRLGREIGSALDYAHRHGVIHRDIKPENILLHDGAALVADFGIALAVSQAGGNRMTETGLSLGTPGYMSPEQATGERGLDARADVYSLGCLLYEMLAGQPPHTGPTVQAVIAAVVTKEPERLSIRRPSVPPYVEAAVHKALAKLPADRWPNAEAFVKALGEPGSAPSLVAVTAATPVAPARRSRTTLILAGATVALAAIAAWGWFRPSPHPFLVRYALALRNQEAVSSGLLAGRVAISPDGRRIIYVGRGEGNTRLWVKDADQVRPTPLSGTDGATSPFFSPDGRQIGYVKDGRTVRVLPLEGGSPLTLTDSANATAADWGSDGYIYFEVDSGISRIPAGGGHPEPVYKFAASDHVIGTEWPVVLPGARGLLFRRRKAGQAAADYDIMVMPLPKGKAKPLMRGIYARYSRSGHLVVITAEGKLLVVPFNLSKLELSGPPVALYEGLELNPFGAAVALSNNGTLVYQTASQSSSRELVWVSREGVPTPVDQSWKTDGTIITFALSPNGRSIAVELQRGAKSDIWVKQLPSGPFSRITFGDTNFVRPAWTPDGNQVLFLADRGDGGGIPTVRRADGIGPAVQLRGPAVAFGQALKSHDGKWLVLRRVATDAGNGDIYGVSGTDTALVPLVVSPASELMPTLSPDNKWLAYASDESGNFEVYVRPFPNASSARWQVSTAGGTMPAWSHSGQELFFRNNHGDMVAVTVKTTPTFSTGEQKTLFPVGQFVFSGPVQVYDVAPDDHRFLMLRETSAGESGQLIVSEHWFEEVKARSPH